MAELATITTFYKKTATRPFAWKLFLIAIILLFLILLRYLTHPDRNTFTSTEQSKETSIEPLKEPTSTEPPKETSTETLNEPIKAPSEEPPEEPFKHVSPFSSEYTPSTCSSLPRKDHTRPASFRALGPPKRELTIFYWRYVTYETRDANNWWSNASTELCPYPPELVPFFRRVYDKFAILHSPGISEWPIGYAPCKLWYYFHGDERGECKNGQRYHIHANYTLWREADIMLVDYPHFLYEEKAPFVDTTQLPPRHSGHTWWFHLKVEGLGYYWFVGLKSFRDMFDLTMGAPENIFDIYHPSYPIKKENTAIFYNTNVKYENKRNDVLFAWMAGNCNPINERQDYVQKLMTYAEVHSYGYCLHNKNIPAEILKKYGLKEDSYGSGGKNIYDIKKDTFSPYKFILAFENSNCEGYVTEKVYDALLVDAIPIYMGAPDIDDYVPPGSVIKVSDYESISALVEHTKTIAANKTLYESYFAWKKDKTHKNFCKKCHSDESIICKFLDRVEWV